MKTYKNIENWDLIAKYFSDECNQEEIDQLEAWSNENEENQLLFNQVKKDLEIINLEQSMERVNVDSAWKNVKSRIQKDELDLPMQSETKSRSLISSVFKYAAAIIILIGVGFFSTKVYQNISENGLTTQYASNSEQGKEIILPDGSKVVLNAESKIKYSKSFEGNERKVELEGEAFFDVTKNPEKPFIIEVKDAEVRVLGTSFNVNASIPGHKVEVFVQTGLVQLTAKKNSIEKILINPGNVGVLDTNKLTNLKNKNKNIIAWKTKELVFHEDSLNYVFQTLNKVYKTNIECENENILNAKYTVTFRDQDLDSVLNVICLTFNLKQENTEEGINLVKYDI